MQHQQVRRTNPPERQRHASATTKPQLASNAGAHPLIQLQRADGNQAVQRLMRSQLVEERLSISQLHAISIADDFLGDLGPGRPLDSATRSFFEPGFASRPVPAVQRAPDTPKTKRLPGYVYLASGSHLTHHLIEAEKKKVRLLFARYRVTLDESWLLEGEESGMPVLYLRWQSEWGSPPSLWMDPDVLEAFLQRRLAVESFEFATKPYEKEEYELTFSDEEKRWIQEVLELPEMSLLFRSFKDLPAITLHRVREIESGAAGQTSGTEVAVSSTAYKKESRYSGETGKMEPATSEEEFKGTLIHELLHFVKGQTGDVKSALVPPSVVMMAMVYPEKTALKLPRYAFGWFEHPKSGLFLHFDTPEVYTLPANPNLTILGTELDEIRKEKKYEPSPMPRSGDTISPEEDLAATMSLYLTSSRSRKLLETKYPLRYGLIEWYFKTHLPKVDKERLAGTK